MPVIGFRLASRSRGIGKSVPHIGKDLTGLNGATLVRK